MGWGVCTGSAKLPAAWRTIAKIYREQTDVHHFGDIIVVDDPRYQMSDEPAPPKPFGEAVDEAVRGIKDWFNGPETSKKTDPSIRETVNGELDKISDKYKKAKSFPGIL